MYILTFIIILAVLVFIHELGHFIVAKKSGIRVDEFGIGFPPRIYGKKIGETVYSVNWIPFGGFVKIFGENPDDESIHGSESSRSMINKPRWIQAFVLVAGVAFNILFAWLLISIGFMSGMPTPADYSKDVRDVRLVITSVLPGSPAEKSGIMAGDQIESISFFGDKITNVNQDNVQNFIYSHGSEPIQISYKRGSEQKNAVAVPTYGIVPEKFAIGISMGMIGTLNAPFYKAIWYGAKTTYELTKDTAISLGNFILSSLRAKANLAEIAGPIGIAGMVGDASKLGFIYLLSFAAVISINLAIVNLIPFPALDGGRLLFVLIEKIKGSRINPKVTNAINTASFALLILLMVVVTYHDIARIFIK